MSNIFFQSGLDKCKEGKFESAIKSFNLSLEQEPQHLASLYNRGKARHKIGDFKGAIKDFDEALNLAPKNADIWCDRGVSKHLLKESEDALKDMDKAAELEPENPYRYSSRAFVKAKIGDWFGAKDDYLKAIDLDPDDAIAYNNLGLLEQQMGYQQSADSYFKRADKLNGREDFKRPDLKEILKEHNEKSANEKEKLMLNVPQKETQQEAILEENLSAKNKQSYWQIVSSVFTSKEVFKEFVSYITAGFKLKK